MALPPRDCARPSASVDVRSPVSHHGGFCTTEGGVLSSRWQQPGFAPSSHVPRLPLSSLLREPCAPPTSRSVHWFDDDANERNLDSVCSQSARSHPRTPFADDDFLRGTPALCPAGPCRNERLGEDSARGGFRLDYGSEVSPRVSSMPLTTPRLHMWQPGDDDGSLVLGSGVSRNLFVPRIALPSLARHSPPVVTEHRAHGLDDEACTVGLPSERCPTSCSCTRCLAAGEPSLSARTPRRAAWHCAQDQSEQDAAQAQPGEHFEFDVSPRASSAPPTTPRLRMWQRGLGECGMRGQSADPPRRSNIRTRPVGPTPRTQVLVCPGAGQELAAELWQRRRVVEATEFGSARGRAGRVDDSDGAEDCVQQEQNQQHCEATEIRFCRPVPTKAGSFAWLGGDYLPDLLELRLDLKRDIQEACASVTERLRREIDVARQELRHSIEDNSDQMQQMQAMLDDSVRLTKARIVDMATKLRNEFNGRTAPGNLYRSVQGTREAAGRIADGPLQPQGCRQCATVTERRAEMPATACKHGQGRSAPATAESLRYVTQTREEQLQRDLINLKNATNAELDRMVEYTAWRDTCEEYEQRLADLEDKFRFVAHAGAPELRRELYELKLETERSLLDKVDVGQLEDSLQSHERWMEDLSAWLRELVERQEGMRRVVQHLVEQVHHVGSEPRPLTGRSSSSSSSHSPPPTISLKYDSGCRRSSSFSPKLEPQPEDTGEIGIGTSPTTSTCDERLHDVATPSSTRKVAFAPES